MTAVCVSGTVETKKSKKSKREIDTRTEAL